MLSKFESFVSCATTCEKSAHLIAKRNSTFYRYLYK